MTRGHRGSLLLRCRAPSSPSPCRFIPAHTTSTGHTARSTCSRPTAATRSRGTRPIAYSVGISSADSSMNTRPPEFANPTRNALAAGVAETGGGILFAAGLAMPFAAAALSSVMLTALRTVLWKDGIRLGKGGYETLLLASAIALAEEG